MVLSAEPAERQERRRAADGPVPLDIDLGAHVPDRDVIPHDLESYDAH